MLGITPVCKSAGQAMLQPPLLPHLMLKVLKSWGIANIHFAQGITLVGQHYFSLFPTLCPIAVPAERYV